MTYSDSAKFNWYHSLNFKIVIIFFILLTIIVLPVSYVLYQTGEKQLSEMAYDKIHKAGRNVIHQLELRTTTAKSLAFALVALAKNLPADEKQYKQLARQTIDFIGTEHYIAGGGIWPEPFQFDKNIERRSFFWGRDDQGLLNYYDDYNLASGSGYHRQEWYVPSRYLDEGGVYWSKSYIDPYSFQSMVTITAPIFLHGVYSGATTIDLKLEGLSSLLKEVTQAFGGYSFAIDHNGTFLSFPEESLAKNISEDKSDLISKPYITINELAEKTPEFIVFANMLSEDSNETPSFSENKSNVNIKLVAKIKKDIDGVSQIEAENIVNYLSNTSNQVIDSKQFYIDNDYFLQEAAFVSIITMPKTHWKIITVMPHSEILKKEKEIINQLNKIAFIATCSALFIILFLMDRILTNPIKKVVSQLKNNKTEENLNSKLISTRDKGELSVLNLLF